MTTTDYTALAIAPPHPAVQDVGNGFFADLEQFKVDMKEAGLEGAEEQLSAISTRKPPPDEYVRVHPGKDMTITVALHESRDNFASEHYIVMPKMLSTLMDLRGAFFAQLYVTATRSGATMIWPVKLPTGGASNPWYESALKGAALAKTDWIRIFADPGQKQYRIMKALGEFDPPKFPDKPLNELLEIAFKGRVIDSNDHPVCRKLRGEV
ncbi:hypothetical protein [Bradyrhizobium elkanii]|uniref:hypothetical protein n=1 Tax=Bradyrhizobium elkanii TaxID=29448 RepID=UPI0020A1105B|nr:hypothetical protein [Bradyrhizobium elkanii]MCP1974305.1 hypothetical protein [Bradyrhizobium elkanii]MCS4104190.1 hypothetical protein [Bradyrhizobium elkanii]